MTEESKWRLILEEHFDGGELDSRLWTYEQGGGGYGNHELQNYTSRTRNVRVTDSHLVIEAHKESFGENLFTSGKIISKNKFSFQYGKVEIRAKLPEGQGIWPAFWMLPENMDKYEGWPSCGEIDIMELIGHEPDSVYGTLHYGIPHTYTSGKYTLPEGRTFSGEFNIFSLEWAEGEMVWSVNDQEYFRMSDWFGVTPQGEMPFPAPFNEPFYLQINLAVGGDWPGYPDPTTVFPQQLRVDYIKVYEPHRL